MVTVKHFAVLGIGSNITGRACEIVEGIISKLSNLGFLVKRSGTYTTRPYGKKDPELPAYTNAVVLIETELMQSELESKLKSLEDEYGRIRTKGSANIPADIDIVIWDGNIVRPQEIDRDYFAIGYKELKDYVETIA